MYTYNLATELCTRSEQRDAHGQRTTGSNHPLQTLMDCIHTPSGYKHEWRGKSRAKCIFANNTLPYSQSSVLNCCQLCDKRIRISLHQLQCVRCKYAKRMRRLSAKAASGNKSTLLGLTHSERCIYWVAIWYAHTRGRGFDSLAARKLLFN